MLFALPARPLHRRVLAWLLSLVVAIQGMNASTWAVQGPAHAHAARDGALVLSDLRREPARAEARHGGFLEWLGHAHAHASAERHHHAPADASVVATGDDLAAQGLDAGAALTLLALMPALLAWHGAPAKQVRAFRPLWVPMTGGSDRLERPPRSR